MFSSPSITLFFITCGIASAQHSLVGKSENQAPPSASPPNLLFIIVDDLRTDIGGAWGNPTLTPNLDRLQSWGVSFTRAYTQVTLCSPSRTSLWTGRSPGDNRLWTIGPYFRDTAANGSAVVTLPQALRLSGYNTASSGKVWHPGTSSGGDPLWAQGAVGGDDAPYSWSPPADGNPSMTDPRLCYAWECDAWVNSTGQSPLSAGLAGGTGCETSTACVACLEAANATNGASWDTSPCGDECYVDSMIATHMATVLSQQQQQQQQPWAHFVGFKRPHLGYQIPDSYLSLYPANMSIATDRAPPPDFPHEAWYPNGELLSFSDMGPSSGVRVPNASFPGMVADWKHAQLRRAYYAAVTFMDAQLGIVLDALEASGGRETTFIVFTADHGYLLGEHGNWAKQTLFDATARVPLIIAPPKGPAGEGYLINTVIGPWVEGAFVELLDLFPTLLDILLQSANASAHVPPGQLRGRSLVPLLKGQPPTPIPQQTSPPPPAPIPQSGPATITNMALTQIIRQDPIYDCSAPVAVAPKAETLTRGGHLHDSDPPGRPGVGVGGSNCTMGLSIRVPGWRYSAWVGFKYGVDGGRSGGPIWSDIRGEDLYDHRLDDAALPGQPDSLNNFSSSDLINLQEDPAFAATKAQLLALLMNVSSW